MRAGGLVVVQWLVVGVLALLLGLEAVLAPRRAALRQGGIARAFGAEPDESTRFTPAQMRAIGWILLGVAAFSAAMWWRDPG